MNPDEPETITFLVTELTGLTGETEVIEMTDAASGPLQRISIATFPGRKLLLQLNLWWPTLSKIPCGCLTRWGFPTLVSGGG
jgi:hypothetical protein